jgi:outer membrane protein assembly factor BamB
MKEPAMEDTCKRVWSELNVHAFTELDNRYSTKTEGQPKPWLFDVKAVLMKPGVLSDISDLFWQYMRTEDRFQVGGLETTAIALGAGIVMRAQQDNRAVNAFYIRKSRKKEGLHKHVEGTLTDEPVVLVDDILNTGKSMLRQIKVLEAEGKQVIGIYVLVAFRDTSYYRYLTDRGIRIWSAFTLNDFPQSGGPLVQKEVARPALFPPFKAEWKFTSENAAYEFVLPKSAPVCDTARVYFGADNGTMWALNQSDGSVAWRFDTLFGAGKKRIFSSPALHGDTLYFGAYDGNFYALDCTTGAKRWVNFDADWIGSSPCIAEDLGLVYVGLEFGLWKKQGGITALDLRSGTKKWWYGMESYVHSSPVYNKRKNIVAIGSNGSGIFLFDANSGKLLWKFTHEAHVKGGLAFDEHGSHLIFGSFDGSIYILRADTGEIAHRIATGTSIYSTPLVRNGIAYMGLLDKRIVAIDILTGKMRWYFNTSGRVFATPDYINGAIYCGSNDGRLYELDPDTGKERSFYQVTERIVNKVSYNASTGRLFLPTHANELYCLTATPIQGE